MATLPTPGGDSGTWGTELNEFFTGTGSDVSFYVAGTAYHQHLNHGSSGSPVTAGSGPTVKVCRTEAVTEASMPSGIGANNQGNAAIWAASTGTAASEAQAVGLMATAASASTQSAHNDDACAINAQASIQGSGTGTGIGAYIEGRRDTSTGKANGLEVAVRNYTAANGSYNASGFSTTTGIWLVSRATNGATLNGCGLSLGNPDNVKFEVGIGINSNNGGACSLASFRDDGTATDSLAINGTHTYALRAAAGAGKILVGSTTDVASGALLEVVSAGTTDPLVAFGTTAAAHSISMQLRNSAATGKWFLSGGSGAFVTGSASGDMGFQIGDTKKLLVGIPSGTVTLAVEAATGTSGKIGFFGTTTAAKQTVTGAKGSNAALGSLLTALAAYGLITDSSSA